MLKNLSKFDRELKNGFDFSTKRNWAYRIIPINERKCVFIYAEEQIDEDLVTASIGEMYLNHQQSIEMDIFVHLQLVGLLKENFPKLEKLVKSFITL